MIEIVFISIMITIVGISALIRIESLNQRLHALESENSRLKKQLNKLEKRADGLEMNKQSFYHDDGHYY